MILLIVRGGLSILIPMKQLYVPPIEGVPLKYLELVGLQSV